MEALTRRQLETMSLTVAMRQGISNYILLHDLQQKTIRLLKTSLNESASHVIMEVMFTLRGCRSTIVDTMHVIEPRRRPPTAGPEHVLSMIIKLLVTSFPDVAD